MKTQIIGRNRYAVNHQRETDNRAGNPITRNRSLPSFAIAVVALFMALSQSAHAAGPLTSVQVATEVMMHTQADVAGFIATQFGVDPNSSLSYSTYVDPGGQSFTFSLNSGTTFLGQPLALTESGTFVPSTRTWNMSGSALYGSTPWTLTSSLVLTTGPNASVLTSTSAASWSSAGGTTAPNGVTGENCTPTVYNPGGLIYSSATCYFVYYGTQNGPTFQVDDDFSVLELSSWSVVLNSQYWKFSLYSQGSTSQGGGAGSFTAIVGPAQQACVDCGSN